MSPQKTTFQTFLDLVLDQFKYGGKKYAHSNTREATDVLFDKHGKNWLFGTIDKYTFRFKTVKREKDLLKIATYMFITWLKRGFHIDDKREVPIDTNITVKFAQFPVFVKMLDVYDKLHADLRTPGEYSTDKRLIDKISEQLQCFSQKEWKQISQGDLVGVFYLAFYLWERNFKDKAGEDTDTWNEGKGK